MRSIDTQSKNEVVIVGKLIDVSVKQGTKEDKDWVSVLYNVRVEQEIEGKAEIEEIKLRGYANRLTSKGTENKLYTNFVDMGKLKTIQNCGIDDANMICAHARLTEANAFKDKRNEALIISERPEFASNFVSVVGDEAEQGAFFESEMVLAGFSEELDRDGYETTGRLNVRGVLAQYGGRADVLKFVVEDHSKSEGFQDMYTQGDTICVNGRIRCTSVAITKPTTISKGWGESAPVGRTPPRKVLELVITGGHATPNDEDNSYDNDEIGKAMATRKTRIQQEANREFTKPAPTPAPATAAATSVSDFWANN